MHIPQQKKIIGPSLPPKILHRTVLVKKLNEIIAETSDTCSSRHKLILLCAPSGYGKTTLLVDLAKHTNITCCWYLLDRTDTDKITFLETLLASIRYRFPTFGKTLDPLLSGARSTDNNYPVEPQYFEAVIDALVLAITTEITDCFAILLCNYHEINDNQIINALVDRLLQNLPSHCILIIESRTVPDLDFSPLLLPPGIFSLNSNALRFTTQEIRNLAHIQGVAPLSDIEAEQLASLFDGWIAGILLGTRLEDTEFLYNKLDPHISKESPTAHVNQQKLFSHLVNETFKHEPDVYDILKDTAMLQQIPPSLCSNFLGLTVTEVSARFQRLEQQGLFVTHSDDDSQIIYTCHPVLRDFLCEELRSQSPARFKALHRRAAELWHNSQDYDQAIYHAVEASAHDLAADLIIEIHEQMFAQGHTETLARWIDELPEQTTTNRPKLLLIRIKVHLMISKHTHACLLLDKVSIILTHQPLAINTKNISLLQAESYLLRSKILFLGGEYIQAQALCQQVLALVPTDNIALCAEAHTRLGVCANLLGDFVTGISELQKALQLWGHYTERHETAGLHGALASGYSLLGNFVLAEHHLSRAISCCDSLNDERGKVNSLIRMAIDKQRQNAFVEAETILTQALTIARGPIRFRLGEAYALVNLGELSLIQKRYDQSLETTKNGLTLACQSRDKRLINYALCILSMAYLYTGDTATATLLLSETDVQTPDKTFNYEYIIHELARGTILLHKCQYNKAYACLTSIERSLNTPGLKNEWLQVTIRIAACQLAQGYTAEATYRLEEMTTKISQDGGSQDVLLELSRLSTLEHAIKTMPELERVRTLLHQEIETPQPAESLEIMSLTPQHTATVIDQPRLRILALGDPRVFLGENTITNWRMARAMELFFFLLDCNRPMRKEQIITALWSESDKQIDQTFYSTIHYLRKALGESCIISLKGTYTLNLASQYGDATWYDVAKFQEHHIQARQALSREDNSFAKAAFCAMIDLYQGDYVQSFYSDWCISRRDELRQDYLEACRQVALIAWHNKQFDESAIYWRFMLTVDNCMEEAHYGLMRCFLRQGKRGLALRQYQRCRDILQEEFAILPGAAIQNLYQHLVVASQH